MTTEQQIDHHERARRLAALLDTFTHVRGDWADNHDDAVDLDGEIPVVAYRYATSEWDGSETVLVLGHTLEECVGHVGDFGGEYPWVPGEIVLDLDTGWEYELFTHVTARRRTWELSYTMVFEGDDEPRKIPVSRRLACTEDEAREEVQKLSTEYLANTAAPAAEDVKLTRIAPDPDEE
jgi:hypothetical protein